MIIRRWFLCLEINLTNYDIVIWFVGDESTVDVTFSLDEQNKIKTYLYNGGNMLVTGSEIAWDLDNKGDATDKSFYHDYFKSSYFADGGSGRTPATGVTGTDFEGVTLNFGQVYPEDYLPALGPYRVYIFLLQEAYQIFPRRYYRSE